MCMGCMRRLHDIAITWSFPIYIPDCMKSMVLSDSNVDEPILEDEYEEVQDDSIGPEIQSEASEIILLMLTFLLKFQIIYKISDNAISMLLRFFKHLIKIIGNTFRIQALQNVYTPISIHGCHSLVGIAHQSYKEYVICSTCHMLFDPKISQLVEGTTRNKKSVSCKYIQYPHHTQLRFRAPCNTVLMNKVKKRGNRIEFRARKTYFYYGLKTALTHLLNRRTFLNSCNSWKSRLCTDGSMGDFTDGKVWLEETQKFTNSSNVLGFLMNIDWFQPFKDTSYSVGVIYLVIVNLPRNIRYKDENVIIVGVIPGPKEPSHDINSYLGPLVNTFNIIDWNSRFCG